MLNKETIPIYNKISQELRRGILILATLSQLKEAKYGYALIDQLAQKGLIIDQGTLYPLLRRLEKQGLLDSHWNTTGSRPRRYYLINKTGTDMLALLTEEWAELTTVVNSLLLNEEKGADHGTD